MGMKLTWVVSLMEAMTLGGRKPWRVTRRGEMYHRVFHKFGWFLSSTEL